VRASDADLVRAIGAGGPAGRDALDALYRRFGGMVHGVLLSRVTPSDADDLTQEVFLKAATRIGQLRSADALGPWLAGIARSEAAGLKRGAWRFKLRLAGAAREKGAMVQVPLKKGGSKDVGADDVLRAIGALPQAYQESLVLRLVEGLTGPQIALALGMTHGSVRVNLTRGMGLLRRSLGLEAER
jgi:RNA polymerase sigma-70 factor (ECF subfamily)